MPNLSFHAGPEVSFSLSRSFRELREHTKPVADQKLCISNRPDVQSQHPGAGNLIQGPGGGMGPGQGPPPGQSMGPGHGGFQYK